MTKPKAKALGPVGPGAFVHWKEDESVPDLRAVLRGTKADPDALAAALAGPLGAYRAQLAYLTERALPSALRDLLLAAASNVGKALADGRLRRQNLPPLADSAIYHAVCRADFRRDGSRRAVASISLRVALLNDPTAWDAAWADILKAGNQELIASILRSAAASIDRDAPRRRPGDAMRDDLFLVVVKLLSEAMDAKDARDLAGLVLEACGVGLPDAESVARSIRRRIQRPRKPGQ